MTRIWKEKLDPERHLAFPRAEQGGHMVKHPVTAPHDKLIEKWVYFVNVCSFTFQFMSTEQIQEYLEYFSLKPHPSHRNGTGGQLERWINWKERLPLWLFEEPKRVKVVKALQQALEKFEKEKPYT